MENRVNLHDYLKSLSEASQDDNGFSLIVSPCQAYKLDDFARKTYRKPGNNVPSACDAFWESKGKFWFIEFKNQKTGNVNKMDIWKKALNSIFIARMIINQKISLGLV